MSRSLANAECLTIVVERQRACDGTIGVVRLLTGAPIVGNFGDARFFGRFEWRERGQITAILCFFANAFDFVGTDGTIFGDTRSKTKTAMSSMAAAASGKRQYRITTLAETEGIASVRAVRSGIL